MSGIEMWAGKRPAKNAGPLEITGVSIRAAKADAYPTVAYMDVVLNHVLLITGFRVWQRYPDLPDRITVHSPETRGGVEVIRGINDSQEAALHTALVLAYIKGRK